MDTEKIHIQFAVCCKGSNKATVLAYFGYGNYYPLYASLKNKSTRFSRFSMLNKSDNIDVNYYISEMSKQLKVREKELRDKIDNCQQHYQSYFSANFDFTLRRNSYIQKTGQQPTYCAGVDRLMMLEPVMRTKSATAVAYVHDFYS